MVNPYPGPRPFTPAEYGIFAGRDQEIADLSSLIVSHQVVLLYAQSGAGKTSLVNAGLRRPLADKDVNVLPSARVGIPLPAAVSLDDVANVYTYSAIGNLLPDEAGPEEVEEDVGFDGGVVQVQSALPHTTKNTAWKLNATLSEAFARIPDDRPELDESGLRLFVIDQFEELFGVYPQRWRDREPFFQQLSGLLKSDSNLRVLLVLREDYLAAFNEFARILPEGARTRYRLERLREAEALSAVNNPLKGTDIRFAPGVAETMVNDLLTITVADPNGRVVTASGEFVEPVQLQVVCYSLFDQMPEASGTITMEDYRRFGDPDRALEVFYRNVVKAAATATGLDEGDILEWCESKLITPAGTRGLVFQSRTNTAGISNDVVAILEQKHLIRPEIRSGARWYELTHDRLVRPIQNSNQAWKAERWSKSFEVQYAEAIRQAKAKSGVSEEELRSFLDSLVSTPGDAGPGGTATIPQDAVSVFVGAGLLRRIEEDDRQRLAIADEGIAAAVRLANQSWRGENWPQAKRLRELQATADAWAIKESMKELFPWDEARRVLIKGPEARKAIALIQRARASGVGFSSNLDRFIAAVRREEVRLKHRWAKLAAAVSLVSAIVLFLIPLALPLWWKGLLSCMGWLGGAVLILVLDDDDDIAATGLVAFTLVLLSCAAAGYGLAALTHGLVARFDWSKWIWVPVTLFLGFFTCAIALGIANSGAKRG